MADMTVEEYIAEYRALAKEVADARVTHARMAANEQCIADVCPLCEKGIALYRNDQDHWHHRKGPHPGLLCYAWRIHERLHKEKNP